MLFARCGNIDMSDQDGPRRNTAAANEATHTALWHCDTLSYL